MRPFFAQLWIVLRFTPKRLAAALIVTPGQGIVIGPHNVLTDSPVSVILDTAQSGPSLSNCS